MQMNFDTSAFRRQRDDHVLIMALANRCADSPVISALFQELSDDGYKMTDERRERVKAALNAHREQQRAQRSDERKKKPKGA